METVASIIILVRSLLPVVTQLGVDPLHFGIVLVVNLAIGMVTPPRSLPLRGVQHQRDKHGGHIQSRLAFIPNVIVDVLLITYIPWITTVLPKLAGIY
ncbi:hypothetical protein MASR2M17_12570 [Aminivibrio sp.]